jgi:transposase
MEGLQERRRGPRPGEQMALTYAQQAEIVRLMDGRNPDQLQIDGVLWSTPAVKALIEQRVHVTLTRQAVGKYLRRWGWSSKKPQKRWLQQLARSYSMRTPIRPGVLQIGSTPKRPRCSSI